MKVYIRIVIIMMLEQCILQHKNLFVKGTIFPPLNLHKCNWNPPNGKNHNQTDHILIDRRWHSSILYYDLSGDLTVILITIW